MSGLESYAHKHAKEVFAGWLREIAAEAGRNNCVSFGGLEWRVNRPPPSYGVWLEYPVGPDLIGIDPAWDEISSEWSSRPPTYEELKRQDRVPRFVADIAVQHKGMISALIEIVHKHPPSKAKRTVFREAASIIVIPAAWVLGQVGRPESIPDEFFQ